VWRRAIREGKENRMNDRLKQQALRTLRAIRERYETGRDTGSDAVRSYSVQISLGYADMLWIAAAIEALEETTAPHSG
jgi:hypothetical protein